MGEILGLGVTHYPGLSGRDENMAGSLKRTLQDPRLPEHLRDPSAWPQPMREEWGSDKGAAAAARHRNAIVTQMKKQRQILDEFKPDFLVIWGDDQYENFHEDLIPPFCILAYEGVQVKPWEHRPDNCWDEPQDKVFAIEGHPEGGRYLTRGLLEEGIDVAYAYRPLHKEMGHAFYNTVLYLDYDRKGFEHKVVPVAINCYGKRIVALHGGPGSPSQSPSEGELDPPSPSPRRCFELGAATAKTLARSPWRVALVASSSWSHAFLTPKNHYLHPDTESDRGLHAALLAGDYEKWRSKSLASVEDSGQQELLNWFALAGAMAELDRRPDEAVFVETGIFNSNKVFAVFNP